MLIKTTLAVLAELIKEDASLKLAQGSFLLLSVSLVFFPLSAPHLSFLLLVTQDSLSNTKTGCTTTSSKVIDGKCGLHCNYALTS